MKQKRTEPQAPPTKSNDCKPPTLSPFDGSWQQVSLLCKSGQLKKAQAAFERDPDAAGAASLIAQYGRRRDLEAALAVYDTLVACSNRIPTAVVFSLIINACRACKQPKKLLSFWTEMR